MATGFVIVLSLLAGVVGFTTSITGLGNVIQWTPNLHAAYSSSLVSWLFTLLDMGLACKEIDLGWRGSNLTVVAEYNISMHCNACERSVVKVVLKIKGVEKFVTDMANNRVVITGRIDPQKVRKKLKKKTSKRVELMEMNEEGVDGEEKSMEDAAKQAVDYWLSHYFGDSEIHMMFNEENANACSIM